MVSGALGTPGASAAPTLVMAAAEMESAAVIATVTIPVPTARETIVRAHQRTMNTVTWEDQSVVRSRN